MASVNAPQPTEDYKRLQLIEEKVIACVKIAAQVTEHFSKTGCTAELAGPVQQLCTNFMTIIAEALQLVKEGAEASTGEHRLELHAYHNLSRAHIATEKLQVMRMHLEAMQEELEAAGAWEPASGGGEGGAGPRPREVNRARCAGQQGGEDGEVASELDGVGPPSGAGAGGEGGAGLQGAGGGGAAGMGGSGVSAMEE